MRYLFLLAGMWAANLSCAQPHQDGLTLQRKALIGSANSNDQVLSMVALCHEFSFINFDSAYSYGSRARELARKTGYVPGEIKSLCFLGMAFARQGNLPKAIELQLEAIQLAQTNDLEIDEAIGYYTIGKSNYFLRDYKSSIYYCKKARKIFTLHVDEGTGSYPYFSAERNGSNTAYADNELILGEAYLFSHQLDSALTCLQALYDEAVDSSWQRTVSNFLGYAVFLSGKRKEGLKLLQYALGRYDGYNKSWTCSLLAECYHSIHETDSAIHYAKIGLAAAQEVGFKDRILQTTRLLATLYEDKDINESHKYLKMATAINNEMFGQEKVFELQNMLARAQQQKIESEKQQLQYENNIRFYSLASGLLIILATAGFLYRNNRQKQKANKTLQTTLSHLRTTQSQLIQSEKMASLGELTAGIAHEIQNPLNFVNNFSEVSKELLDEMEEELKKGNNEDALQIAKDIINNLEKINFHGKRADGIVKSMLQHSRKSSGQKELTDINVLCDEYLRLAYHGLRAKDKSFNAKFETHLDPTLPKINAVPQDIGRVVLNLINNAFYAVGERQKAESKKPGSTYEPSVTVSTRAGSPLGVGGAGGIVISVTDNGSGIPAHIKDKIFQPFFTTKPTGLGTGLGLSLSYDIVKAHGGELNFETADGVGSDFVITLQA